MSGRRKGLLYTTYSFGIGHLVRCLNLSHYLLKEFDIDLIRSGIDCKEMIDSPHFRDIRIPSGDFVDFSLKDLEEEKDKLVEDLFARRLHVVEKAWRGPYDFLMTEMFPFGGKIGLGEEVLYFFRKMKKENPSARLYCSCREVVTPEYEWNARAVPFLRSFYDRIFVHSDPAVFRFEDSFSLADQLESLVTYTGFVLDPTEVKPHPLSQRDKRIVVSVGAGRQASSFLLSVVETAKIINDYEFLILLGPHTPEWLKEELKEIQEKKKIENLQFSPLVEQFEELLAKSALSISLSGSTIWNVYHTKTPALFFPYRDPGPEPVNEMVVRAKAFEERGLAGVIHPEDLSPNILAKKIREQLKGPYPDVSFDVSGGKTTTNIILQDLKTDGKPVGYGRSD